jgi:hypothetical protein
MLPDIKLLMFGGMRELGHIFSASARPDSDTPRRLFISVEVFLMSSFSKLKTTALIAAVAFLCASTVVASPTRSSANSHAWSHLHSKALSSRSASRTASHNSAKAAIASTRRERKGKPRVAKDQTAKYHVAAKPKFRGQQAIDEARTLEIQQALIREHYLDGEATGQWDQATRDALARLQSENHWQTKIIPDARALIKLGLGPSQQNLLNPETAAVAMPYQSGTTNGGSN